MYYPKHLCLPVLPCSAYQPGDQACPSAARCDLIAYHVPHRHHQEQGKAHCLEGLQEGLELESVSNLSSSSRLQSLMHCRWARKISHTGDSLYDEENPRGSSDSHHSRAHSEACAADGVELETRHRDNQGPVHAATMPPPSRDSSKPLHINSHANGEAQDSGDASLTRRKTNKTDSEEEQEKPGLDRHASTKSRKRKQPVITPWTQFKHVVFGSWVNILLLAVPAGFAVNYAHLNGIVVFVVNFIAIVPLAGMLSYATEELAMHIGETLGGLLNASFG